MSKRPLPQETISSLVIVPILPTNQYRVIEASDRLTSSIVVQCRQVEIALQSHTITVYNRRCLAMGM
ncbi:hypothetical protein TNCV_3086451 [Trichonephila clavipes]|nr:hypothetical protein TNCV_3086451 [Trichonephila clavipes]